MYFKSTFIVTLWVLANSIDTCLVPKSRLIDIINRKYELKELLGSGFFGEVYRAIDRDSNLNLALKTFKQKKHKQCYATWGQVGDESLVRESDIPHLIWEAATPAQKGYFVPIFDESNFQLWETAILTMELLEPSKYSTMTPSLTDRSTILLSLYISIQAIHAYSTLLSPPTPLVHRDLHFGNIQYRLKDWKLKLYDFSLAEICTRMSCSARDIKTIAMWLIMDSLIAGGLEHAESLVSFWEKNILSDQWIKERSKGPLEDLCEVPQNVEIDSKEIYCEQTMTEKIPPMNHKMRRNGKKVGLETETEEFVRTENKATRKDEIGKEIKYIIMKALERWMELIFARPEVLNDFRVFSSLAEELILGSFDINFFLTNHPDERFKVASKKFFEYYSDFEEVDTLLGIPWDMYDSRERVFEAPFKRVRFADGHYEVVPVNTNLERSTIGNDGAEWFTADQILANERLEFVGLEYYPLDLNPLLDFMADALKTGKHNSLTRRLRKILVSRNNNQSVRSMGSDVLSFMASGSEVDSFEDPEIQQRKIAGKVSKTFVDHEQQKDTKRFKKKNKRPWARKINKDELHFAWSILKIANKIQLYGALDYHDNIKSDKEKAFPFLSPSISPCEMLGIHIRNGLECETQNTIPEWFIKRSSSISKSKRLLPIEKNVRLEPGTSKYSPFEHSFASEECLSRPCSVSEGCDPPGRLPFIKFPFSVPDNPETDYFRDERYDKNPPVLTNRGLVMGWSDIPRGFESLERARLIKVAKGGWNSRIQKGLVDWATIDWKENVFFKNLTNISASRLPSQPPTINGTNSLDYGAIWSPSGIGPLHSEAARVQQRYKKRAAEAHSMSYDGGDPDKTLQPLRRDSIEYREMVKWDPSAYNDRVDILFYGRHIPFASEINPELDDWLSLKSAETENWMRWKEIRETIMETKASERTIDRAGRKIQYAKDSSRRVGFGEDLSTALRRLVLCHPYVRQVRGVVGRWLGRSEKKLLNLPETIDIKACKEYIP